MKISTSGGGAAYSSPAVANPLTARMHKGINTTADEGQTPIIQHGGGFDGAGITDVAPTLGAGGNQTGGVRPPGTTVDNCDSLIPVAHALRGEGFDASEDGTGRGTPIVPIAFTAKDHGGDAETLGGNLGTVYANSHASTPETDAYSPLLKLREAVGEEAFAEWGLGISHSLQQANVLRSGVHGEGFRGQAQDGDELGDDALSCAEDLPTGAVRALWNAGCAGCPPQGWQPPEQLARELGAHLSKLSHQGASSRDFLHDLWRASQGLGPLREALPAPQEARRPDGGQNADQKGVLDLRAAGPQQGSVRQALHESQARWGVRRLTPREAERLMGFPDDFTLIPWRGKAAENCPDGVRYKALGNSIAVNVISFIGERIEAVRAATGGHE